MIRRGLQITFVVGIMALGAAPSFGQYDSTIPWRVTVTDTAGTGFSGVYVQTGTVANVESGISGVYQRYVQEGGVPLWATWRTIATNPVRASVALWEEFPTTYDTSYALQVSTRTLTNVTVGPSPSLIEVSFGNVVVDWYAPVNPNAAYEEAFPDWESAGVKIPLGFALGMAFWAAAVALTIPMKWIKELASAAS